MQALTRKAFYDLAQECRTYAMRLATSDPNLVSREHVHEFNRFLARVREYDALQPRLKSLQPGRALTRTMLLAVIGMVWLLLAIFGTRVLSPVAAVVLLSLTSSLVFILFLIPPAIYGTSVEAIEGRVLAVVEAMQDLLESGDMQFSEAAYFAARDTLRSAADELRQQVYLNRNAR